MKIAFISDAHGNYIALDRVLELIQSKLHISDIYFLGDAVGYMPETNKVISRLKQDNIYCLMGNHEAMLLEILPVKEGSEDMYQLNTARKGISPDNRSFIERLIPFHTLNVDSYHMLMVHGSPADPLNGYLYEDSKFYPPSPGKYHFVFMGHTHRPYILQKNNVTYVNVGSCGLPRDVGNLASFAVFDTEIGQAKLYRVSLDMDAMINLYKDAVHPGVIECLLRRNAGYHGELIS